MQYNSKLNKRTLITYAAQLGKSKLRYKDYNTVFSWKFKKALTKSAREEAKATRRIKGPKNRRYFFKLFRYDNKKGVRIQLHFKNIKNSSPIPCVSSALGEEKELISSLGAVYSFRG